MKFAMLRRGILAKLANVAPVAGRIRPSTVRRARKSKFSAVAAMATAAALVMGAAGPAQAAPDAGSSAQPAAQSAADTVWYNIKTRSSALWLQTQGWVNNSFVEQANYEPVGQDWAFDNLGNGYHQIRQLRSQLCMRVPPGATGNVKVVIYDCGTTAAYNSQWRLDLVSTSGPDWYRLYNRSSGKCLHIPANSFTPGVDLIQAPCQNGAHNQFTWSPR